MKKFIKGRWFPLIVAIAILALMAGVVLTMMLFGCRFTFAPELETSWDAVAAVATWAGVVISAIGVIASFIAIWYAIQVPKKIADRQDKIALFEKRYACFQFFEECFVLYKVSLEKNATEKIIRSCYDILKIESPDALSREDFKKKSKQCEYILHQIPFLFEKIGEKDIEELYGKLSIYLYAIVYKKQVEKEKQDYIRSMNNILKYYNEIWDSMTISSIK